MAKLEPENDLLLCVFQQNAQPLTLSKSAACNLALSVLRMASALRILDLSHEGLQLLQKNFNEASNSALPLFPLEPKRPEVIRSRAAAGGR